MGDYETAANGEDSTLQKAEEMDISQRIQDVAKKLCLADGHLWNTNVDPHKIGGLTDEEKKQLTLEQEEVNNNRDIYITEANNIYDRLSSIDYTITTK